MKSTATVAVRSGQDPLRRNVQRIVGDAISKFGELTELQSVERLNDDQLVNEVIRRSGIEGEQRELVYELLQKFAGGLQSVAERAEDRTDGPSDFSLDLTGEAGEVFQHIVFELARVVRKQGMDTHARFGALMLMCANLETLIASIAETIYRDQPESLSTSTVSLGQLEDLGSVAAVRSYLIQGAVDSLMHGGIADWEKHFKKFDVNIRDVAPVWWSFREIDARRNLVAHADAKVNDFYLKIARENGASELPSIGSPMDVSSDYLISSGQTLSAFAALFGVSVLLRRRPAEMEVTYRWGAQLARDFYQAGENDACRAVSEKLIEISHGRLGRTLDLELRHLSWLATKCTEGVDAVRKSVQDFDYSGLDVKLVHVRYLLLDSDDEACSAILDLVDRGALSRSAIRLQREYAELLSRAGSSWLNEVR